MSLEEFSRFVSGVEGRYVCVGGCVWGGRACQGARTVSQ